MRNFRPTVLWFALFALLAHVAGDVSVASTNSNSVCETQSQISAMVGQSGFSVCDLQRALKIPGNAPLSPPSDADTAVQAMLVPTVLQSPLGHQFAPLSCTCPVSVRCPEVVRSMLSQGCSLAGDLPPSSPLSRSVAAHAPPQLS